MTSSSRRPVIALTLDLDDTLLDEEGSTRDAVRLVAVELGVGEQDVPSFVDHYMVESGRIWAAFGAVPPTEDITLIRHQVWSTALATFGIDDPKLARAGVDAYHQARRLTYRLFPDVLATLVAIRDDIRMAILTNGVGPAQREKCAATGLDAAVDDIFVSGEFGTGKPDARFFLHALSVLGASPEETAHVGDSVAADVVGALGAGLLPIWIDRRAAQPPPVPHMRITAVAEVTDLIADRHHSDYELS